MKLFSFKEMDKAGIEKSYSSALVLMNTNVHITCYQVVFYDDTTLVTFCIYI